MNESSPEKIHTPVLLAEVVEAINPGPGRIFIDCTVGIGGHTEAILERSQPGGRVLGIDADPMAIRLAGERLKRFGDSVVLINANFSDIANVAGQYNFQPVDGIILDLGVSSLQLEQAERGFSFAKDAPLDMRFGPTQEVTAADIVNELSERELADLIFRYGEEKKSRQIAKRIVLNRPLRTTGELAKVIEKAVGFRPGKIHPATRTFQAIRIAVNEELKSLEKALPKAVELLVPGGRLVVISFHSLEDRIVKDFMRQESKGCICPPDAMVCSCGHTPKLRIISKKAIVPTAEEQRQNPRSRSAKMRVSERL